MRSEDDFDDPSHSAPIHSGTSSDGEGGPKSGDTKTTILDAAAKLFAMRGFDGVSFRDITEECGAKRSLILYHFGSKEELWRQSLKHVLARVDAILINRPLPDDGPYEQRVFHSIRNMIDTLLAVPEYGQILVREGGAPSERLDWIVANFTPAGGAHFVEDAFIRTRMRSSMTRDMVIGSLLGATALGPFLEASTAAASRVPDAGIYPMNADRRDELATLITRMIVD